MKNPINLLAVFIKERVCVKLKTGVFIRGVLEGVDEHLNILLSNSSIDKEKLVFFRGENVY